MLEFILYFPFSRIKESLERCFLTTMCIKMCYWWLLFVFERVKTKTSAKYGLEAQPRLVDIIAAVPPQYRRALVPKLKAKPIRTASGVCSPQVAVSLTQSQQFNAELCRVAAKQSALVWSKKKSLTPRKVPAVLEFLCSISTFPHFPHVVLAKPAAGQDEHKCRLLYCF